MGLKHWILQSWMLLTVIVCGKGQVYQHTPITEKIPLGAIFEQGTDDVQSAFKYAMLHHNNNKSESRRFELQAYVDVINTADAFKLSRLSKIFSYIYIFFKYFSTFENKLIFIFKILFYFFLSFFLQKKKIGKKTSKSL